MYQTMAVPVLLQQVVSKLELVALHPINSRSAY